MSDHSSSVFNNSCLKAPTSAKTLTDKKKTTLKSFLEFYGSIPEYDDVNHLSNKEFYRRLESLREKQRLYAEKLKLEECDYYGGCSRKYSALRRSVRIETPSDCSFDVDDLKLDLQQRGESKSAPASPIRSVGWKDTITIPQPFQMTVR